MFEDTSKQLSESHSLQIQLANKLEENQKYLNDFKIKYQNLESDHIEMINDLQNKLNNYEGLTDAYEIDINSKKQQIIQLEQSLSETKFLLDEAQSQIESEKTELSNLETVRKDLEAQRSFYTNEIKDNDIKGTLSY